MQAQSLVRPAAAPLGAVLGERAGALGAYLRSPSTRAALCIGALLYVSYAGAHDAWTNGALAAVAAVVGLLLPLYSRASNRIEERINRRLAVVTLGRLGRFAAQLAFNLAALWVLAAGGALRAAGLDSVGGVTAAAVLTTLASQGAQYLGIALANRNLGDRNRNVQAGLSANVVVTALGTAGLPGAREAFLAAGIGFGALVFGIGVLSDLRAVLYPRRGVGVFFGTFNPFHRTHLELVRRALDERNLETVVVHPTIVPRLHAQALERGEIRVARVEGGLQVYEKTDKADANVDYFPTGRHFFAPETRRLMIELALAEAGLGARTEVAYHPETYRERGFHGVVAEIRRRHPGRPLHGIHGSDLGGMTVRAILDECGWIYSLPVRRRDGVSATAIRAGADGMTTPAVAAVLRGLNEGAKEVTVSDRTFRNDGGALSEIAPPARKPAAGRRARGRRIDVKVVSSVEELMQVFAIRAAVYMAGQTCPYEEEFDGNDFTATQLLARVDGKPAGTLRLRYFGGFSKWERAAVLREYRGVGVNTALMDYAAEFCARKGFRRFYIHAQTHLLDYWRSFGFETVAGPFVFSDHEYYALARSAEPPADALAEDSDDMVLIRPEGRWDEAGVLDRSGARTAVNAALATAAGG